MPRPIWSGSISFGLVNVPLTLLTAVSPKRVRFDQTDSGSKARGHPPRGPTPNKDGSARMVPRTKQYPAAIRPVGNALVIETMLFDDEVVHEDKIDGLPGDEVEVSDKEMKIARSLIDSLSTHFEPAKYRDEYRVRVLEMIEAKAEGQEVVVAEAPAEEPAKVVDLMAALEASLGEAKQARAKKGA